MAQRTIYHRAIELTEIRNQVVANAGEGIVQGQNKGH